MNIPKGALSLIESTDRETTNAFMKMKDYVDLLIPRGGRGLIQSVVNNATIPVIETGTGNCHVYVDQFADQEMAVNIIKKCKDTADRCMQCLRIHCGAPGNCKRVSSKAVCSIKRV